MDTQLADAGRAPGEPASILGGLSAAEPSARAPRPRVAHVVTASVTTRLMRRQLAFLREAGYDVTLVSSPGPELEAVAAHEGVAKAGVPMEREIAPLQDLRSLWRLWRLMRRLRPAVVNFGTAKAALLAGLAAWLARVPCRIYTLHGLRLETARGLKRFLLTQAERVACRCAHEVVCVSGSVRQKTVELGLADGKRCRVLGAGSFNGVDPARFAPTPERMAEAAEVKRQLGFPPEAPVIGFVGRIVRDKGLPELVEAFSTLRRRFPQARLLLLGRIEVGDPVPRAVREFMESDPAVVHVGYVPDPSIYYQVMDMLVLPTYREGFPTVVLEASASGKPVVATRATGAVDAVEDGVTGLLVPVGDPCALAEALGRLLEAPELAVKMGRAGRQRVERDFCTDRVCGRLADLYRRLLESRGLASDPRSEGETLWEARRFSRPALALKRTMDLCGAALGLALAGPAMGLAALTIWWSMGAPVLFRQRRAGLRGRSFSLLKFRTMTNARDDRGRLLPDAIRISAVGRVLRRFSIDELPQLWNVLKGDMSLVGPRPLLVEYLPGYTPGERLRHAVRPGLTGCSQISGRHTLLFSKRLELDSWYVANWSLSLDMRILVRTVPKVLCPGDSVVCQDYSAVDDRGLWRYLRPAPGGSGRPADRRGARQ